MNACLLFFNLLFGMVVFPYVTRAQSSPALPVSYKFGGERDRLNSNVPLNEINIHAFRHFRKRWPAVVGESWIKGEDGYTVSFKENSLRCQARFDARGGFLYSLKYYSGKNISNDLSGLLIRKYPGYTIDVVTEITDGEKVFYLVKVENSSSVKTLSVSEGKVEVYEELINGGVRTNLSN
jgi:hypothetical protein